MASLLATVGAPLVSAPIQRLIEMATDATIAAALEEIRLIRGVKQDKEKLVSTLQKINMVLAKRNPQAEHGLVGSRLDELSEVVYDAEDVLDEFATETALLSRRKKYSPIKLASKSLTFALEDDVKDIFLALAVGCASVICCRSSPKQKALVTRLVKTGTGQTTLAIGDGANDVGMLQEADIGIGINGPEGMQRMEDPSTSDYRFRRIPRQPWAANPELDSLLSENLEQWPHLNELVQCYKADWVKDENKYGHYESVVSPTFQGQIFEGPDIDIETGFSWHWIYPTCYYSQNWKGKTRARDAALNAIQSPLLDIGIERATRIVWNITGGNDLMLYEVNAAAEVIYDLVDPSANLIFGAVIDHSLSGQLPKVLA